jgi:hypothetical protein
MTSKPDNLTPGAQYIYERTYKRELRVDPINIPLSTSELSNLIKGKSMTYKPYKPLDHLPPHLRRVRLLAAKEIMETQPMTEKGDIEIAYKYINEERLAQFEIDKAKFEIKSAGKIQTWDPTRRPSLPAKVEGIFPCGAIPYQTEKGAPSGYISSRPVYLDEAGTLSYNGKPTGSPTTTGYTEINPPPVAKEDLTSTYNVYATTTVINDYESLAAQREDEENERKMENDKNESEPYTPGYHNYEAYKPSLGKLDCQKLNTLGTFASADISHMTRLERITAGLEKDPYVAHRNSYKGVCEKGCEYGLPWATDLQKPKPVVGIQDQSGEEFEIWDSMSATYMNKK